MQKPLPSAQAGQAVADPTIPYKDAAFALLTHEDGALMTDDALRKSLKTTLASWTATNFADRLEDTSQMFVAKFSAHLHSMRLKDKPERVWLADIDSSAGDLVGQREIFKDVGKKVARKLAEDGMIIDARPKK